MDLPKEDDEPTKPAIMDVKFDNCAKSEAVVSVQPERKVSSSDGEKLEFSEEDEQEDSSTLEAKVNNMLSRLRGRAENMEQEESMDQDEQEGEEGELEPAAENDEHQQIEQHQQEINEICNEETVDVQENEITPAKHHKKKKKCHKHVDLRDKLLSTSRKRKSSENANEEGSSYSNDNQVKCLALHSDLMDFESVTNDLQKMQEYGIESDCEVKVGEKVYKCHSAVLKRNENNFRDLLSEKSLKSLSVGKDGFMIEFENVKSQTFDIILRYLYKASLHLHSFEEALEVLFAAQTLSLDELIRACTRFCVLQMTGFEDDFWAVLDSILKDQADPYQLSFCQVKSFDGLLMQNEFMNISLNSLKFVVEQEFLTQCNEVTLIEAVEQWAQFHLQKNNIRVSQENLRHILGGSVVISKLRYRSLSQNQLVYLFKKTELLSKEEKLNLHECCITKNADDLMETLNSHRYSRDKSTAIRFFLPKCVEGKYLNISSGRVANCSFFFAPKKDIVLLNFLFYSQVPYKSEKSFNKYSERYSVQVLRVEGDKMEVLRKVKLTECVAYSSVLKVDFPVPIVLKRNRRVCYAIKLTLHSAGSYFLKDNSYLKMQPYERFYLEPLKSDFCWGNDGIFQSINYKIL